MTDLRGRRVLVAEDEALVRFLHVGLLEDAGCIVVEAADGAEALSKLADETIDLLLTDIRMPKLDGWALAERARELLPTLPVLYVTGWSDVAARPVAGSRLISKPYVPSQLLATVEALIEKATPVDSQC